MRYVIQALPTEAFFGEKFDSKESHLGDSNLRNLLLFGYAFDAPDEGEPINRDDVWSIVDEVKRGFSANELIVDIDDIKIEHGSVTVTILIGACIASTGGGAAVVGAVVSGLVLLAAAEFFKGALNEFGRRVAEKVHSFKSASKDKPIFNAKEEAKKHALEVAQEYGCSGIAIMEGGMASGKRYRYKYRFTGEGCKTRGILVWVDPYDEHVKAEVQVWE